MKPQLLITETWNTGSRIILSVIEWKYLTSNQEIFVVVESGNDICGKIIANKEICILI